VERAYENPVSSTFLTIYSGVLTLVFIVTVISGFSSSPSTLRLEELTVGRINIVEPNGTRRMPKAR
jgi:hypothetical protein